MTNLIFAQSLQKGDPILIPFNGRYAFGIFSDMGKNNNPRFYRLDVDSIPNTWWCIQNWRSRLQAGKAYRKSFINRSAERTVAKLDVAELEPSLQKNYMELKWLLQQKGIL